MHFFLAHALGQIDLQDGHFISLNLGQIFSLGLFVSGDGVFSLLDQFVNDGHNLEVIQGDAFIDFFLFHGRLQQANGAKTNAVLGLHGRFHVFSDGFFKRHFRFPWARIMRSNLSHADMEGGFKGGRQQQKSSSGRCT